MGSILSPGRGLLGFSVPREKADMQRGPPQTAVGLSWGQSDAEPGRWPLSAGSFSTPLGGL